MNESPRSLVTSAEPETASHSPGTSNAIPVIDRPILSANPGFPEVRGVVRNTHISMKTKLYRLGGASPSGAKSCLIAALMVAVVPVLQAQTPPPPPQAEQDGDTASANLSDSELDDLLGPIALYPDALVGLILPASTVPSDITLADRYLQQNGNDANVDDQPWDQSVRGLARYPDVLKWMDDNLEWTTSVGEAFINQPADVMNSIQRLRQEAKDKGNLTNTPQQTVVVEQQPQSEVIRIVPTDPDVIYVPQYDPQVVYVQPYAPDYGPVISFGVGFGVGTWLSYDFDWWHSDFYYGEGCGWNNHDRWYNHGWSNGNVNVSKTVTNITNITNNNNVTYNNTVVNRWRPSATSRRMFIQRQRENLGNARIARANAQAAHVVAGQPNRVAHVPRPTRLAAAPANPAAVSAQHRQAEIRTGQANRPATAAPTVNGATANPAQRNPHNPNHPARPYEASQPGTNPGNSQQPHPNPHHPHPVTAAPAVNGAEPTSVPRHERPQGQPQAQPQAGPEIRQPNPAAEAQRAERERAHQEAVQQEQARQQAAENAARREEARQRAQEAAAARADAANAAPQSQPQSQPQPAPHHAQQPQQQGTPQQGEHKKKHQD